MVSLCVSCERTKNLRRIGTQSLDLWQYSGNDKDSSNYRYVTDGAEVYSAKGEESQQRTSKQPLRTSACDQCYRFKVKCTREPECCQRCSFSGNACTYSAAVDMDRSRKRPAVGSPMESPKKKPASSSQPNFAQSLEGKPTALCTAQLTIDRF